MPEKNKQEKNSIKKIINPALAIFTTLDDISQKLSLLLKQGMRYQSMGEEDSGEKKLTDIPEGLPAITEPYDKVTRILTSQPVSTDDPLSGIYQREYIYEVLKRKGKNVHLINDGPGLLFVIATSDGITWTNETFLLEGEHKMYDNVYEMGLRSPVAGLTYRVSERDVMNQSAERFSGSRFVDRRDRKGVIIFQDDYESPTLKFSSSANVLRSNTTSYAGDFSVKLTSSNANPNGEFVLYNHNDFHLGKIGVQIHFASANAASGLILDIDMLYFNGTTVVAGDVRVNAFNNTITIIDPNGNFITPPGGTNIPISSSLVSWNVVKLVIDINANKYVSVTVNGVIIDLSTFDLQTAPSPLVPLLDVFISSINQSLIPNINVFYDNYILTEDEPGV